MNTSKPNFCVLTTSTSTSIQGVVLSDKPDSSLGDGHSKNLVV